ncbi:DUF3703 domain-containing protein [Nocardia sp. GTS18]|uniref:DUF3703 domain-containing protein n=1 Tax=Nocardia sp. GTS18 TaxID=1778064 RepID=UPI0015EF1146|nr:DUF3703 domain-containing protein [Nocardia sp. GTS18]
MSPMPAGVRSAFEAELDRARLTNDVDEMWHALERAHILSQEWAWPHTRAHWEMLRLAIRCRDRHEVVGQVLRLAFGGIASATGRAPLGNNGRSDVGPFTPMPIPADLLAILAAGATAAR